MMGSADKDVKPVIDQNAQCRSKYPSVMPCSLCVDWDQYYASLENSAQATPTGLSAPGSSDFGDLGGEDEEDIKPSVEYLDSLNEYRKRSRSNDGVDTANKVAKVEQVDPTAGLLNGAAEAVADVAMEEPAVPQEDPIVYGEFSAQFFVSSQSLKRNKQSQRQPNAVLTSDGGGARLDDTGGVYSVFPDYAGADVGDRNEHGPLPCRVLYRSPSNPSNGNKYILFGTSIYWRSSMK